MAAVPSTGRASGVEAPTAQEAAATRELYERYSNQILAYCLHQLGSREEAEDAVQSTFLNAFRGLKRGVVPEQEAAWLFKIAQNVCLSRRRATWRRGRIESPTDFELVEELTPAPSRVGEELMGLQDVLEQMPETQRRAILLREWQGLSYREIADELEVSQAAVETLIFRARRTLAKGLEAPPEPKRARLRRGADLGNLLAGIKSLLLGGAGAVKVAATVAVVSGATVAATAPVEQHLQLHHGLGGATPAPATQTAHAPATQARTFAPASAVRAPQRTHAVATNGVRHAHVVEPAAAVPATPAAPAIPAQPATPALAATPAQPAVPATPAAPAVPATPAAPATQNGPAEHGKSDESRASQSTSAGASASPPGQATAPGQAKKDEGSAPPADENGAANPNAGANAGGNGNGKANGNGKDGGRSASPLPAPAPAPVSAPPSVPAAATLPPSPSLAAPGNGSSADHGNSGDHAQGRGH